MPYGVSFGALKGKSRWQILDTVRTRYKGRNKSGTKEGFSFCNHVSRRQFVCWDGVEMGGGN
jgi:hypothetical protein